MRLIDFGCAQSIQIRSNGIPTNYESTVSKNIQKCAIYEGYVSKSISCISLIIELFFFNFQEFLAPELVSQGPVGTYTDMWAFGVLLYVALR